VQRVALPATSLATRSAAAAACPHLPVQSHDDAEQEHQATERREEHRDLPTAMAQRRQQPRAAQRAGQHRGFVAHRQRVQAQRDVSGLPTVAGTLRRCDANLHPIRQRISELRNLLVVVAAARHEQRTRKKYCGASPASGVTEAHGEPVVHTQ
jgi:hypothetical protein